MGPALAGLVSHGEERGLLLSVKELKEEFEQTLDAASSVGKKLTYQRVIPCSRR